MLKKKLAFLLVIPVIACLSLQVFAHSGRTDSRGGHTNHSTGEYHYHHGYSAHDHTDMNGDGTLDCPYEFKDNTDHSYKSATPEPTAKPTKPAPTIERSTEPRTNDGPRISKYQQPTPEETKESLVDRILSVMGNLVLSLLLGGFCTYFLSWLIFGILGDENGCAAHQIAFVIFSLLAFLYISHRG